jgi:hypothetical protein
MVTDYDRNLYTWSHVQAALLRERKFDQIDLEHIAEEIEDMGKSEQRALESCLEALLMHLLKWVYQTSFIADAYDFVRFGAEKDVAWMERSGIQGHPAKTIGTADL